MSIFKNALGETVPVREQRRATAILGALNAELQVPLNGDESALIDVRAAANVTATISFQGTVDGTNWFPVLAMPYYALTGTLPSPAQPLITEAWSAVIPRRVYALATGGLAKIRVLMNAWTLGQLVVTAASGPEFSIHPSMFSRTGTLGVTVTAAVGVAATLTLPLVAGLRHYVDFIDITRSATAALTPAAAPVLVTTTNLPGNPVFTFGADAGGVGVDKTARFDAGASGMAATALGTNTTVVAPAYTGVIWRITAGYRLGL